MKTHLLIISIVCMTILIGCQPPPSKEIEVSILFDITSSTENKEIDISTSDILGIFDLQDNPDNHGKLRISTLTETHLSEIKQLKLPPVVSMNNYNKYSRENEINNFIKGVDSLLSYVNHLDKGKRASSLFIPISKELKRLNRSSADNKVLLCSTDLFEHSSTMFSVYSQTEFDTLVQNPANLTELLTKNAPLPEDLKGVKVYIIYNPVIDTDSIFLAISQWYKELLESKGAEVYIGANLVLD